VVMRFRDLDEMIASLRERQVGEVSLAGKVATTTSPGGEQISFRGRLIVSADLGSGERGEYVEQVEAYVTQPGVPEVPVSKRRATELQRFQMALTQQLRAYRGEYQGLMEAARRSLTERLGRAGIRVVEPGD